VSWLQLRDTVCMYARLSMSSSKSDQTSGFLMCPTLQVAKVVVTRSARDISISWSVLYSIGLTLSLAYLILMVRLLMCFVGWCGGGLWDRHRAACI
jgi:hypothetical protein